MKNTSLLGLVVVSLLGLVGCGDPAAGSWESHKKTCGSHRDEFTIEEDGDRLTGDGTVWVSNGGGCTKCSIDVEVTLKRDNKYDFTADARGSCNGTIEGQCTLSDDDNTLTCEIDGSNDDVDFDRVE